MPGRRKYGKVFVLVFSEAPTHYGGLGTASRAAHSDSLPEEVSKLVPANPCFPEIVQSPKTTKQQESMSFREDTSKHHTGGSVSLATM